MSPAATALLAFFVAVANVSGLIAWRVVGPRRWPAVPLPMLAAFGALYIVGHAWIVEVGPTLDLFGFDVALPLDLAVALAAAFAVAALQRPLLRGLAAG